MHIQHLYLLNISEPCVRNLEHKFNIHCWALPLLPWWLLTCIFITSQRLLPFPAPQRFRIRKQCAFVSGCYCFWTGNHKTPSGFNLTGRVGQGSVIWSRCWTSQQSDKNSACRSQAASAKLLNAQHYTFSQPRITTGTDA